MATISKTSGELPDLKRLQAQPAAVTGVDPAEGFVAYAREHVQDSRASFKVGNAMELPFEQKVFDAVVSGLVFAETQHPVHLEGNGQIVSRVRRRWRL